MGRNKKKREHSQTELLANNVSENNPDIDTTEENKELSDVTLLKRPHASDDSDTGDNEKPKKPKKKKKPLVAEESTGKKNKKSIRQMKREKHAERLALEQATAKDQIKSQCLNYLSQWKHDKQNWKFMKAKQVWLHKNMFSTHLVPDASWPVLLEYFESAKGNIKTMLLADASKIIKQMDEWTESQMDKEGGNDKEQSESTEVVKPDETVYKRARNLIQCLEE